MQGKATYFAGESPTDFDGYSKKHCMCLAMLATDWDPISVAKISKNQKLRHGR